MHSELIFHSRNPLLLYLKDIYIKSSSFFFHTGCLSIKKGIDGDKKVMSKVKKLFFLVGREKEFFKPLKNPRKLLFSEVDYSRAGSFIITLI